MAKKLRAQQHGKHFLYNLILIAMTGHLENMTLNIIELVETSTNAASWSRHVVENFMIGYEAVMRGVNEETFSLSCLRDFFSPNASTS